MGAARRRRQSDSILKKQKMCRTHANLGGGKEPFHLQGGWRGGFGSPHNLGVYLRVLLKLLFLPKLLKFKIGSYLGRLLELL